MSKLFGIFTEGPYKEFSWRKIMTAGALVCFMTAVMGYLVVNDFDELPISYQAIISGVFAFYFMKSILRNVKSDVIEQTQEIKTNKK